MVSYMINLGARRFRNRNETTRLPRCTRRARRGAARGSGAVCEADMEEAEGGDAGITLAGNGVELVRALVREAAHRVACV